MQFEEFERDVFSLRHKIFRLARWMVRHDQEAEDVVQEILLRLWKNRMELGKYNSLEAFVIRITKNFCLDKLKAKGRFYDDIHAIQLTDPMPTPEEQTENTDFHSIIKQLIMNLPEQQRLIMQLRTIEGYNFEEIEAITGMTINAIRVTLSRARQGIRDQYQKKYAND